MNKKGTDMSSWSDEEIKQGYVIRNSKGRLIVIYADGKKVHYKDSEFVKKSYSEKKQYIKEHSQNNQVKNADIDKIPANKIEEIYKSKTKHKRLLNTESVQNAKHEALESRDYLTKRARKLTEQKFQLEADKDDPDTLMKINKELDNINDKLKGGN